MTISQTRAVAWVHQTAEALSIEADDSSETDWDGEHPVTEEQRRILISTLLDCQFAIKEALFLLRRHDG